MLYIPGFLLIRLDSDWNNLQGQVKKGGVVCCYINTNLNFTSNDLAHLNSSSQDGEILHVIIEQPHVKKCVLINVYSPPQGNIDNFNDKIIDNITHINNVYQNAEIIMLGDFNLNILDRHSDDFKHMLNGLSNQQASNN